MAVAAVWQKNTRLLSPRPPLPTTCSSIVALPSRVCARARLQVQHELEVRRAWKQYKRQLTVIAAKFNKSPKDGIEALSGT